MPDLCQRYVGISIHALLAESDVKGICFNIQVPEFLSTLSLRRATIFADVVSVQYGRISIHALLAESDMGVYEQEHSYAISIHALLAESDLHKPLHGGRLLPFLSTLSLRRATTQMQAAFKGPEISIHALLAESDY